MSWRHEELGGSIVCSQPPRCARARTHTPLLRGFRDVGSDFVWHASMAARRGRSRRYYCVLRPICYLLHGLVFRSFLPYYNTQGSSRVGGTAHIQCIVPIVCVL